MSIIILKAKVKIPSEEFLELEDAELGIKDRESKWYYRRKAVIANDIINIVAYSSGKTLVTETDGTRYLVSEPFDIVLDKWQGGLENDLDLGDEINEENETNNEEEQE